MNRILMAAARGARVQYMSDKGSWFDAPLIRFDGYMTYRIHPDDEHLQYGVVSSALRAMAEEPYAPLQFLSTGPVDLKVFIPDVDYFEWAVADKMHRSLFLLILSEALADEGL